MQSLETLGAVGGEVTGSASLLRTSSGAELLVDFGMFQGEKGNNYTRNRELGFDPSNIQGIFITHAHLDHLGKLPLLAEASTPVYMTAPTYEIARVALRNANALSPGLYPPGSVEKILNRVVSVPYDAPLRVDGTKVTFRDAGHILGSASIEFKDENGDIAVFSGDLGNTPSRIVRPTKPIKDADIVVMETTYGDREHSGDDPVEVIAEAIKIIRKNHGTLLIPAFAIDRTQIILNILRELRKDGRLGKIPVYLDSPMAMEVTRIYNNYPLLLNENLRDQKHPFKFPDLIETYTGKESYDIQKRRGTKIIVAGSGMMSGGRINKHAVNHLPDKNTVILFVGYSAKGTPSRAIKEGDKYVSINGDMVDVNARVMNASLSAHADQTKLLEWLRNIYGGQTNIRKLILVHGDNNSQQGFASKAEEFIDKDNIVLAQQGTIVDFSSNNTS